MNKTYMVRFFTRDIIDGYESDEHEIARFESNKYIPIPNVGDSIILEDDCNCYEVTEVDYCYPCSEDEEYSYDINVFVEMEV